jgi:hypothetical protein
VKETGRNGGREEGERGNGVGGKLGDWEEGGVRDSALPGDGGAIRTLFDPSLLAQWGGGGGVQNM